MCEGGGGVCACERQLKKCVLGYVRACVRCASLYNEYTGMVIKPKHQSEDAYTVVGFVVYQQLKKRTQIQVLLMPANDIGVCCLSYEAFLRICEDEHRFMLASDESVKASKVARHIVGLISKGAQALIPLADDTAFGKAKPPRKRAQAVKKAPTTCVSSFNDIL